MQKQDHESIDGLPCLRGMAGDDFAAIEKSGGSWQTAEEGYTTLGDHMYGGGYFQWYKDGTGSKTYNADWNFATYTGKDRYSASDSNPVTGVVSRLDAFYLKAIATQDAKDLAFAALESSGGVLIRNNTARNGGGVGSNGKIRFDGYPGTRGVSVSKVWEDDDDHQKLRPAFVRVELIGTKWGKDYTLGSAVLNEANNWTYEWTDLSEDFEYSVREITVPYYTTTTDKKVTADDEVDYTITNRIERTSVNGTKIWNDNDDADGNRPDKIVVIIKGNGTEVRRIEVTADEEWSYKVDDLYKYDSSGNEIDYTTEEVAVESYYTSDEEHTDEKVSVTGTYTETVTISGKVTFDDASYLPDAVTLCLFADGELKDITTIDSTSQVETDDGTTVWTYRFTANKYGFVNAKYCGFH